MDFHDEVCGVDSDSFHAVDRNLPSHVSNEKRTSLPSEKGLVFVVIECSGDPSCSGDSLRIMALDKMYLPRRPRFTPRAVR